MSVDEDSGRGQASSAAQPAAASPEALYAQLARINLADTDLPGVLGKVAELARDAVPGTEAVSVTLLSNRTAGTAVFTGDVALALDERQYDADAGPCLDAAAHQTINIIADTEAEERWPAFVRDAVRFGVRSTLSVGIPVREAVTGSLNLYALRPGVFSDAAVERAIAFQDYAAVALANAHLYDATAALAKQMAEAMASRAVIEQAKGVVIAQRAVSSDEAFELISRASQAANRKVRDIAQAIVEKAQRSL